MISAPLSPRFHRQGEISGSQSSDGRTENQRKENREGGETSENREGGESEDGVAEGQEDRAPALFEGGYQGIARAFQGADAGRANREADQADCRLAASEGHEARNRPRPSALTRVRRQCPFPDRGELHHRDPSLMRGVSAGRGA